MYEEINYVCNFYNPTLMRYEEQMKGRLSVQSVSQIALQLLRAYIHLFGRHLECFEQL
jgi:hypothetical protein